MVEHRCPPFQPAWAASKPTVKDACCLNRDHPQRISAAFKLTVLADHFGPRIGSLQPSFHEGPHPKGKPTVSRPGKNTFELPHGYLTRKCAKEYRMIVVCEATGRSLKRRSGTSVALKLFFLSWYVAARGFSRRRRRGRFFLLRGGVSR